MLEDYILPAFLIVILIFFLIARKYHLRLKYVSFIYAYLAFFQLFVRIKNDYATFYKARKKNQHPIWD